MHFIKTNEGRYYNADKIFGITPTAEGNTYKITDEGGCQYGTVSKEELDRLLKAQESREAELRGLQALSRQFLDRLQGIVASIPSSLRVHY